MLDTLRSCRAAFTEQAGFLYAAAVLRIGYGLLYLVFLLREFPHRDEIWGPGSPWTPALANELFMQTGWSSILTLYPGRPYFEACYALALVTSVLFMLGWRTRFVSVAFAVIVVSLHARTIFMTDGGDNLILLMSVYLCFTACGRRWSLDARKHRLHSGAAGTGLPSLAEISSRWHQLGITRRRLVTLIHNCGMLVIAAQICLLYGAAGLYKVQGSFWADGTALHYVLNLDLFRPWPALSAMVDRQPTFLTVVGYLTVLIQVAFPCLLFSRVKYALLPMLLGMHLGIAVLMGLPYFSASMIVADAVFLPDRFYISLGRLLRRKGDRDADGRLGAAVPPKGSLLPSQPRPADCGQVSQDASGADRRPVTGSAPPP
ncbi:MULTISPECIES: HTTM domain-containing protein [unclassified Streptomyces]|uniref:HTTM domain-containing protein n=1 Tax=unclassified Streptomyces TaxID=2593676 RepID=UPI002DDBF0B3|nr:MULTISPECIES: HTTM domain-containing protein [unclassified Streptomyces]WSA93615.1 HTTM domain-containing protein [Streptomyces sp. NBC_01795]WSB77987.1 HTTM domain-containing protein [Streptomyces sp. NBC_01775]WSS13759.1 HTTM domain-containing protein [Streptomyces sp. NBC_01186]WSS42582.1 HTTM domain-containing protein [Streptomyces sp. NBC_01187]